MTWLLERSVFSSMQQAIAAGFDPTSDQITQFEARRFDAVEGGGRILSVAGNNAEIAIEGVLTKKPSFMSMVFGGGNTTYSEVISALAEAEADPAVEKITMAVDSPGGTVDGLFDTLAAIEAVKKPITAVVSGQAASAAFALVSKADKIVAKNRAAGFGSIGIAVDFFVSDDKVSIASDAAPKKRPDVKTVEGVRVVKEELNALHALFAESIAAGRSVSVETVNSDFGRGAMLFADDALAAGMIDEISGPALSVVPNNNSNQATADQGGGKTKGAFMDLAKLKAEHPAVYAEAVALGTAKERDRVGAFVVAGEASGDMKTALKAIGDGSAMTSTLSTQFMMAAVNRKDVAATQADAEDIDTGAQADAEDVDQGDAVLAMVRDKTGFKEVEHA